MLGGGRQQARRAVDGDAGARGAGDAEAGLLQRPEAGVLPGLLAWCRQAAGGEARQRVAAQPAQPGQILAGPGVAQGTVVVGRSAEHTSELQSLMSISYAVFCLETTHNNDDTLIT